MKNMKKLPKNHLKNTNNSKGQASIGFLMLAFVLILNFIFFGLIIKTKIKEMKNRNEIYQCFFEYTDTITDYVENIEKSNAAITVLNIANILTKTPQTELALKSAIIARQIYHVSIMKKLALNKPCALHVKTQFGHKWPYELNEFFLLKENLDHSTIKKEETWNIYISKVVRGVRRKSLFQIKLDLKFESTLKINAKEEKTSDLLI